ncbi:UDP-N-acetylmuramate dehydrogenase [Maribacter sp. 2307ULW6-5]|uniref:UDP-N-acetylmuramate dehydrogenase n=1 Tax=Maribacter sp. 2307ULW6-5 TaxID=3386275 RepID=UPI0039BCD0B8
MEILKEYSLKAHNTFGIDAKARAYVAVSSVEELREVLEANRHQQILVLGGGSNMLLTRDIEALVVHMDIKGKEIVREDEDTVWVRAMAGENWHDFVLWTLEHDFGGLENLSLIPGNTGTAPIQNIGAYGVELKDTFVGCEALDRNTLELVPFSKEECRFGYRDSVFKSVKKDAYIITAVTFELTKKNHRIATGYGAIESELRSRGIHDPGIKDVSQAVIAIRNRKLPDPKVLGNSGSFFKNPVLDKKEFQTFIENHGEAPHYKVDNGSFKVPAGWLIEQCGFKGKRFGDAGVHEKQALVLVNHGNASGQDILALAQKVMAAVERKFNIAISPEVNLIGQFPTGKVWNP